MKRINQKTKKLNAERRKKIEARAARLIAEEMSQHERNRLALEANERFIGSGIEIKDVYGKLVE